MKKNLYQWLILAACVVFGCAACGGMSAATMHLRKTEGTVSVSDDEDKDVALADNLGLYSGYGVDTGSESYAWIDLDKVKLTKMDEDSEIELVRDGKELEIEVLSGNLFFNVTEPLSDDETMNIRSSSMMVGIRGTCGWVSLPNKGRFLLYLLEGTVECTVTLEDGSAVTETVEAGHYARMNMNGTITVTEFAQEDIPDFVRQELAEDTELSQAVERLPEKRDPMDDYAEVLAEWPEMSDGVNPGLLYAELLDFEADGSPELLMVTLEGKSPTSDKVRVIYRIYRATEDGILWSLESGPADLDAGEYLALAQSGERLYLHYYLFMESDGYHNDIDGYRGSWAAQDGDQTEWGYVDSLTHARTLANNRYWDEYTAIPYEEPDQPVATRLYGEAEYEARKSKYTDVRILALSPDGVTVTVPEP